MKSSVSLHAHTSVKRSPTPEIKTVQDRSPSFHKSSACKCIELSSLIDETPPIEQPIGNKATRCGFIR